MPRSKVQMICTLLQMMRRKVQMVQKINTPFKQVILNEQNATTLYWQ